MLADIVLAYMFAGITAYGLFGGADFGAGIWDLLAGGPKAGAAVRGRIEHSIGAVWEANHVWLIFTVVVLWTGFPSVFADVVSTLYVPFSLAAIGIILRGSAFAFRKEVEAQWQRRLFGAAFALSSLLTPFALGTIAGAIASGRVPAGIAAGSVVTSWLSPTSLVGGVLAVGVCAYLAAVYLCADARRSREMELVEYFRRRATILAAMLGVAALIGAPVLALDAPHLFSGLIGRALPVMLVGGACGLASLVLLRQRHFRMVRLTGAASVTATLWSWAVAQYPQMLPPHLTVTAAAAATPTLLALVIGLSIGAVLVVPSLLLLFRVSQAPTGVTAAGGASERA